jgi:F0F1-type ATP synthase assembly protein I
MVPAPLAPPMLLNAHLTLAMTTPDDHKPVRHDVTNDGKKQDNNNDSRDWQKGVANAWMVLGAAPAGLLIGYFIDRAADTTPWFMLGLSLLFLAVSLYQLVKDSSK